MAAVREQLDRFTHTAFQVAMYESYVTLAERLNALVPGDFPKKTILLTTGVEAVENAVKMARAFTGRPAIVSFTHSFHGRTLLGMSLTGKTGAYKQSFGPFAPEIYHAPYPYPYRGWTTGRALEALGDLFRTVVAADRVAAHPHRAHPRARAASCPPPPSSCARCAASPTSAASCWWRTRSSPAWAAPASCSRSSTRAWPRTSS